MSIKKAKTITGKKKIVSKVMANSLIKLKRKIYIFLKIILFLMFIKTVKGDKNVESITNFATCAKIASLS